MRKLFISTIIALFLGLLAFSASAAETNHPHQGDHCVCGGSAVGIRDHACADIQWQPMPTDTANFAKLASGNYYLTQDLTITSVTNFTNKQLTICLNGYDINTTASAVFGYVQNGSVLNFCDCSGTKDAQGNWTWGGTVTANRTGGSRLYGGIFNLNANALANIYGGNFVGATGGKASNGGVFNICNDSSSLAGVTSNSDPSLYTKLAIYNGHFTGGTVSKTDKTTSAGGIINTWHTVSVGIYGGTFVGGTAPEKGNFSFSSTSHITLENCTVIGGNPGSILIMDDNGYVGMENTLADAIKKANSTQYIRLTGDVNEQVTIPSGVCIDLGGNKLSGVTVESGALFIDSTTDTYQSNLAGSLVPAAGAPSAQTKFSSKYYMTVENNGAYSFHRFYAGITKITLKPTTVGFGYKATFAGSEEVKAALSGSTAYGYRMWLDEDNKITRGYAASRFGGTQEVTLRIDNFLDPALTATENQDRADQKVYACAYLRLVDGTYIESAPVSYSFREMLELTNKNFVSYSETQQNALLNLSAQFSGSMISWDIHNIHHADGSVWQEVNNASFNALVKQSSSIPSGSYVLTEDVDLGAKGIRITAGKTVNICLNGHTLQNSIRMFNNYGNLNFCDCHPNDQEGSVISSYTLNPDNTASEFTAIVYCYYDSVTNLYGGNLKGTGTLNFCGLIAVSHDGKNANESKPVGVFNMYGGTISGGNVLDGGGNITLWNGGIFNMYGGTIYGGSARFGGNINISPGCALNMYGGTFRDGVATEGNGGNIYSTSTAAKISILNICGGTIQNGQSVTAASYQCLGGNIYSTSATVIKNAVICDGVAQYGQGGNIYISNTLQLENATITGGEATPLVVDGVTQLGTGLGSGIYTSSQITATGYVFVAENIGSDLYLGEISTIDAAKLDSNSKINLEAAAKTRISSDISTVKNFSTTMENTKIDILNGGVYLLNDTLDTAAVTRQGSSFRVGYSMSDISPEEDGLTMSSYGNPSGRLSKGINYRLYATTVAITDEQNNTVLMITLDLQGPPTAMLDEVYKRINEATGVPEENIYLTATHTHNCPSFSTSSNGNRRYRAHFMDMLLQGVLDAMADRSDATMSTGSFDTVGMNYSRHYYYYNENGEKVYFGDQFGQKPAGVEFYRVREGDTTMHMLSFERSGKQPVLLVNWRAHPHRSGGKEKYTVDADVIGATREYMHKNTDYLFAYYQGAAGNMNTTSRISGETYKSGKITEYGNELGRQIVNGMNKLKPAETGLIQTKRIIYAGTIDHSQDHRYEDAVALQNYYKNNPVEMNVYENQIAKAAEYGFTSVFHATRLIAKYKEGATKDMELNIFSIGDSIAFYTAPAELWDSFSEELEGESPFETTFCIGYCNGGVAYIPYKLDYYTSYEYFYCLFTQEDTINEMREIYLENLNEQYENTK